MGMWNYLYPKIKMKLNLSQDNFDFIGIIISTDVVQCLDEITILSQKKIALIIQRYGKIHAHFGN